MIKHEDCWYINACNKANTSYCSDACIRFGQIRYLIQNSRIPEKLSYPAVLEPTMCDLDAFYQLQDIKNSIVKFVDAGNNLYLYSHNWGNGKTSWSLKLMLKYFDSIWPTNGYQVRGLFIPVTEFLVEMKHNITLKDKDIYHLYEQIKNVDLVIWDDIGVTGATAIELESLYALINHRLIAGRSNIYTGNLDDKELAEFLGPRLASRIWNNSTRIELLGEDRRNDFTTNN